MGEGDGVYYSDSAYSGGDARPGEVAPSKGRRRGKKAAVAVVGLSAVGAGAYFATTLFAGHPQATLHHDPAALAPVVPTESSAPAAHVTLGSPAPEPGPVAGTKSAVRQSLRPSPTPSPSVMADEEIAALQVSRLLQAPPTPSGTGLTAANGPMTVTVTNRSGTDGSAIRVVSARYDLTGRWELLAAADRGELVDGARCTRNLRAGTAAPPEVRPSMLLCWRTTANKSVVAIAINKTRPPSAGVSATVVDQEWIAMS